MTAWWDRSPDSILFLLPLKAVGDYSLLLIRDGSSGLHWLFSLAGSGRSLSTAAQMGSPEEDLSYCWAVVKGLTPLDLFWHHPIAGMGRGQVDIQALNVDFTDTMEKEVSLSPGGNWLPAGLLWHHCGGKCQAPYYIAWQGWKSRLLLDRCQSVWVHSFCLFVFVISVWVQQLLSRLSLSWSFSQGEQDFVSFVHWLFLWRGVCLGLFVFLGCQLLQNQLWNIRVSHKRKPIELTTMSFSLDPDVFSTLLESSYVCRERAILLYIPLYSKYTRKISSFFVCFKRNVPV